MGVVDELLVLLEDQTRQFVQVEAGVGEGRAPADVVFLEEPVVELVFGKIVRVVGGAGVDVVGRVERDRGPVFVGVVIVVGLARPVLGIAIGDAAGGLGDAVEERAEGAEALAFGESGRGGDAFGTSLEAGEGGGGRRRGGQ